MIQYQIKLKLTQKQHVLLGEWLWVLTGVWNWAVRKIELDAHDHVYHSVREFRNLLAGHSEKLAIPSHTLQGLLTTAHMAWSRCFRKLAAKPRLKGQRHRLNSIPFPDPIRSPKSNRIVLPGFGPVKFHKQTLPDGAIKCGRIVRRASGWYLCLFIDTEPSPIPHLADGHLGIDPGFKHLVTLSTGEKIAHPRELERLQVRLAQAQRGYDRQLAARIQERIANQRKDRNHKLSRRLVAENAVIVIAKDHHLGVAKRFGKSVASSSHAQLRRMLAYKCRAGGRQYLEVEPANSTKTCSACGALSGPTGWAGLSVRSWVCPECGTLHDRDANAAVNTLRAGAGASLEVACAQASLESPTFRYGEVQAQ